MPIDLNMASETKCSQFNENAAKFMDKIIEIIRMNAGYFIKKDLEWIAQYLSVEWLSKWIEKYLDGVTEGTLCLTLLGEALAYALCDFFNIQDPRATEAMALGGAMLGSFCGGCYTAGIYGGITTASITLGSWTLSKVASIISDWFGNWWGSKEKTE